MAVGQILAGGALIPCVGFKAGSLLDRLIADGGLRSTCLCPRMIFIFHTSIHRLKFLMCFGPPGQGKNSCRYFQGISDTGPVC